MRRHACEIEPASLGAEQDSALHLDATDADVVLDLADHDPLRAAAPPAFGELDSGWRRSGRAASRSIGGAAFQVEARIDQQQRAAV